MRAGRRDVPLTHPGKVLFPADGITKADLAAYYRDVADRMVPHVRDRPVSMKQRCLAEISASAASSSWLRRRRWRHARSRSPSGRSGRIASPS